MRSGTFPSALLEKPATHGGFSSRPGAWGVVDGGSVTSLHALSSSVGGFERRNGGSSTSPGVESARYGVQSGFPCDECASYGGLCLSFGVYLNEDGVRAETNG